uniref:Uncharacterized protein n=1 Tax=Oryza glaberrima TaxID=4538 RepID=I1R7P2_ORYGL
MGVLRAAVPLQPEADLVLATGGGERGQVGLVLVDGSNGFCTVGTGNLLTCGSHNFLLFSQDPIAT